MIRIISCPAPFERLEVLRPQPSVTGRSGNLMRIYDRRHACHRSPELLTNDVGQQAEETRALDRAREFALLLGRDGGDAAPADLASARAGTRHKLWIL